MEVRSDLCASRGTDVAQRLCRALVNGDLIGSEVRRAHSQAVEEPPEPPEFTDILDRYIVPAAMPVVLLGVDGDDDNRLPRPRHTRLSHSSPRLPRRAAAGAAPPPAPPPPPRPPPRARRPPPPPPPNATLTSF